MKKSEDTKAILARREAFVSKILSKEETENVKGGAYNKGWCLFICLQVGEPPVHEPGICLTIVNPIDPVDPVTGPIEFNG